MATRLSSAHIDLFLRFSFHFIGFQLFLKLKNSKCILVVSLEFQDMINLPYSFILIFFILPSYSLFFPLKVNNIVCFYGTQLDVLMYVSNLKTKVKQTSR